MEGIRWTVTSSPVQTCLTPLGEEVCSRWDHGHTGTVFYYAVTRGFAGFWPNIVLSHKSTAQVVVVSSKKGHQQLRATKHKEQHPRETTSATGKRRAGCLQTESKGAALQPRNRVTILTAHPSSPGAFSGAARGRGTRRSRGSALLGRASSLGSLSPTW